MAGTALALSEIQDLLQGLHQPVELGLAEICITDHCDYVPVDKGVGYYRPDAYFADQLLKMMGYP